MSMIKFGRLIEEETWDPKESAKKAIMFEAADIGKLKLCSNESLLHYLTKAILLYYLKRIHHRCVCEVEVVDVGVGDVLDLTTNCLYELESEQSTANIMRRKNKFLQAGVDLIIIKLPLHTMDFGEIADYVKMWIRPD